MRSLINLTYPANLVPSNKSPHAELTALAAATAVASLLQERVQLLCDFQQRLIAAPGSNDSDGDGAAFHFAHRNGDLHSKQQVSTCAAQAGELSSSGANR